MEFVELFTAMIVLHFIADYPLQGDFLAKAKNRHAPVPGVPWYHAMTAHCAIHGGMVWLVTGNLWLGFMEFVAHFVTDSAKCAGRLSYDQDQALHILHKAAWAFGTWMLL